MTFLSRWWVSFLKAIPRHNGHSDRHDLEERNHPELGPRRLDDPPELEASPPRALTLQAVICSRAKAEAPW